MADVYCEHGRLNGACEECAYEAAKKRGAPVRDHLYRIESATPETQVVDVDTLVDVGEGVSVLVAAGDAVPASLADKPRRPRAGRKARSRRG